MRVYFDNAATTPIHPEVKEVMKDAIDNYYGNPSSIHNEGRNVRAALEKARKTIASYLNASIGEIFFTSGGTEANNMALKCAVRDLGVERIITSPIEHHCILHTAEALEKEKGIEVAYVNISDKGCFDLDNLETLLKSSDKRTLVSLMHANNEIGTICDMNLIADLCNRYDAFYHSDTVQTIGQLPIDVQATKIDFLSGAAHKFYGPKGVGFIYINGDNTIKPFIDGGSQERNMRGGTENVYGILGMAKALEIASKNMETSQEYLQEIKSYFINQLEENFNSIEFNGDYEGNSLPKVLSVSFPSSPKNEVLMFSLDIMGVSSSGGSACSSGVESRSHVLEAINFDEEKVAVRFSFSTFNKKEEVDFVIEKIKKIIPDSVKVLVGV
ncbi:MAG: cysteine desulfurase [Cognaticolwellia sp.]|jgi:cysteine desulfurase